MKKLGLCICKTDVNAQKMNGSRLMTFGMVSVLFQIDDKDEKSRLFEKTFLRIDISINIAFGMLFLILSNVEINFKKRELK